MERKYEGDVSAACEDALEITSSKPSGKELALKRYIVSRASDCEDAELVVEALCHLGILWRDLSIYAEALNVCRDEMVDFVLPRENDIIAAVNCFGSEEVQGRCVAPISFTSHFFLIMKHVGWIHIWSIRHARLSACSAVSKTNWQLTRTRQSLRQ